MKNNYDDHKDGSLKIGSLNLRKKQGCLFVYLFFLCIAYSTVWANPQDGKVTAGTAVISSPDANTVQVNQASDKAVVDWSSFNVAAREKTQFQQPSTNSIILNRVNPTNGVSAILGQIKSNGQVWLVNPAGVFFGSSARVDVGGLLATTAGISNNDFMSGHDHFVQSPDWHGAIINEGIIVAGENGLVALLAPGVENRGVIQANLGTVILASGSQYTIDFFGDQMIQFDLDTHVSSAGVDSNEVALKNAVSNKGSIIANGGKVLMTADTVGRVLDNAVNMSGYIEAKAVAVKKGEVILMGGSGRVMVAGKINAAGKQVRQKGGRVKILAKNVDVVDGASIDVSGDQGGGEVLIGGNAHGAGPEMNARYTFVGGQVNIFADALTNGDGGKVIVWSDEATQFYGNVYAQGGIEGGNGGYVEVSGGNLGFAGYVNTLASAGKVGTLLLDPRTLTIVTGGTSTLGQVNSFSSAPSTDLTIDPATINAAASNVILQANRDIIFTNAVAMTGG